MLMTFGLCPPSLDCVTEPWTGFPITVGANSTPYLQVRSDDKRVPQVVDPALSAALTNAGAEKFRSALPSFSIPSICGVEILPTRMVGNFSEMVVALMRRMRL